MGGTFYPLLVMAKVWLPVASDRLGSNCSAGFVLVLAHKLSINPDGMHTYLVRVSMHSYNCSKREQLEDIIFVSGGLRSRYPLVKR